MYPTFLTSGQKNMRSKICNKRQEALNLLLSYLSKKLMSFTNEQICQAIEMFKNSPPLLQTSGQERLSLIYDELLNIFDDSGSIQSVYVYEKLQLSELPPPSRFNLGGFLINSVGELITKVSFLLFLFNILSLYQ